MTSKSKLFKLATSAALIVQASLPATAADVTVYKQALPGYKFAFPADHASHDAYKTEWWYYTGHLRSRSGKRYGFELTFFRTGSDYKDSLQARPAISGVKAGPLANTGKPNLWRLDNFYLAHFAVTDVDGKKFAYFEKLNRKGLDFADARTDLCSVFNEGWSIVAVGDKFVLKANSRDYNLDLLLTPQKPPVVHGKDGVSQKASCAGCASHYYSMTRLKAEGVIVANKKAEPVSGQAWMDHEFGSNQLTSDQTGWDWYSLQLSGNRELMLYLMRREDGTFEKQSSGTVIYPDGSSKHLTLADLKVTATGKWRSPKTNGIYPMGWRVVVPGEKLDLALKPLMENQELSTDKSTGVSYWEGAVDVSEAGKPTGEGYVEMTGYSKKFDKKL